MGWPLGTQDTRSADRAEGNLATSTLASAVLEVGEPDIDIPAGREALEGAAPWVCRTEDAAAGGGLDAPDADRALFWGPWCSLWYVTDG